MKLDVLDLQILLAALDLYEGHEATSILTSSLCPVIEEELLAELSKALSKEAEK